MFYWTDSILSFAGGIVSITYASISSSVNRAAVHGIVEMTNDPFVTVRLTDYLAFCSSQKDSQRAPHHLQDSVAARCSLMARGRQTGFLMAIPSAFNRGA